MVISRINLGGEGEIPGVLNQQGRWAVLDPTWRSSRDGKSFAELIAAGHDFLIADNTSIPLPDSAMDEVITESVPIDVMTWLGPGVQSSEIVRILKSGGKWIKDGVEFYVKP